jgi:hypothetical protein
MEQNIDRETTKKIKEAMGKIGLKMFHCTYEGQYIEDVVQAIYLPEFEAQNDECVVDEFGEDLEKWLLMTNTNEYDRSSDDKYKGEIFLSLCDETFTISEKE